MALTDNINDGFAALTNLVKSNERTISDNASMLPFKIGASWYKSGLYYDYMYPWSSGGLANTSPPDKQMLGVPLKILEDTTIKSLAIYCSTAQSGASCKLAIYDSTSDNSIGNLLFGSQTLDLSTTGIKSATCNITVKKGQIIWLASLGSATGTAASVQGINGNTNVRAFSGTSSPQYVSNPLFYKTGVTGLPTTAQAMTASGGVIPRVMFSV